jgi:predicted PurR-regulated permease PerM
MNSGLLSRSFYVVAFLVLLGVLLIYIKPFLAPILFAGLLSMLLLPLAIRFEQWGLQRALAVLASMLCLLALVCTVVGVLAWQIADLSKDAKNMEQQVTERVKEVSAFVTKKLGVSHQKQEEIVQKQQVTSSNKISDWITGAIASAGAAITTIVIVLVYIFLFMYFRRHLQKFVLKMIDINHQQKAKKIMSSSQKVAQQYLAGLALMIVSLWIMYSIGFSIIGVKNAVFFAILCGSLEIVPFVGNLAGNLITIVMSLAQGAGMEMVIGIVITYSIVQFVQSYILEPLIVGRVVNLHPMFTIIGIVAGEFIWGIAGMVLAIPLLGITKIVCDQIEPLQPYGFLLGDERKSSRTVIDKVKQWVK